MDVKKGCRVNILKVKYFPRYSGQRLFISCSGSYHIVRDRLRLVSYERGYRNNYIILNELLIMCNRTLVQFRREGL